MQQDATFEERLYEEGDDTPWNRLDGEPDLWFHRFDQFRLLGPRRSVLAVVQQEENEDAARADRPPEKKVTYGEGWVQNGRTWRWRERARCWDAHERQMRQQEYDADRIRNRENRLKLLEASQHRLVQALAVLNPHKARWEEVIGGIAKITQELRREYDDEPRQRVEQQTTGTHTGRIQVEIEYIDTRPDDKR